MQQLANDWELITEHSEWFSKKYQTVVNWSYETIDQIYLTPFFIYLLGSMLVKQLLGRLFGYDAHFHKFFF